MTGELCDCFETKRDGVHRILAQIESAFPETPIDVWSTAGKFIVPAEARQQPLHVAAANWRTAWPRSVGSSSSFRQNLQKQLQTILLLDVGSTTSDIIPIVHGTRRRVASLTPDRLRSKELVYTGLRAGLPSAALVQEMVMAEFFATAQDAYLVLGMIAEDAEDRSTADGRPATAAFAHARLGANAGGRRGIDRPGTNKKIGRTGVCKATRPSG